MSQSLYSSSTIMLWPAWCIEFSLESLCYKLCVGVLSKVLSIATLREAKSNNLYINTTWIRKHLTMSSKQVTSNMLTLGFTKGRKLVSGHLNISVNTFMKELEQIGVNIINTINAPQAKGNGKKMEMCNRSHPFCRWWDRLAMFHLTLGSLINCVNHFPSALGPCLCLLIKFWLVLHCSLCVLVK